MIGFDKTQLMHKFKYSKIHKNVNCFYTIYIKPLANVVEDQLFNGMYAYKNGQLFLIALPVLKRLVTSCGDSGKSWNAT